MPKRDCLEKGVSRRGSEKGVSRRCLERPFEEYAPLGVCPISGNVHPQREKGTSTVQVKILTGSLVILENFSTVCTLGAL